jgi:hypothetical protein
MSQHLKILICEDDMLILKMRKEVLEVKVRVTLQLVYRQSVRLGVKSLETHDQNFFQLYRCGHSPYVNFSSLARRWVGFLWKRLAFRREYVPYI